MKRLIHLYLTFLFVWIMIIPSLAADMYVYDEAGLLNAEEWADLNENAADVSEKHGYGIYMITVHDYQDYSNNDVFTTATELYHGLELGKGTNREGILLMLSMDDRDYATFFYGKNVEYAFNEYGQIQLEEQFLDDFGDNRWYDGFADYITVCDEYLELAAAGRPVRESHTHLYVGVIVGSVFISFIVVLVLKASMKSVHKGNIANAYVTDDGLNLTEKRDRFLYNTQSRRRIERSSGNSGSRSHSGGGGSGRSGKF